jgi:hypothetical protein
VSHLLDACVFQDFSRTLQSPLLARILPKPCYSGPGQINNPRELAPGFCTTHGVTVPPGVTGDALLTAGQVLRRADVDWRLSDADRTIGAYAMVTGFILLTGDGALRALVQAQGVTVHNSLDLLVNALEASWCAPQDVCKAVRAMLTFHPPRRGVPADRANALLLELGC